MRWRHEIALCALVIGLFLVAGQLMPNFVQLKSQLFLSKHAWETAILAIGMTLIIIAGGIDLSVGSLMGLCAVGFGMCFQQTESVAISSLVCVAIGAMGGLLNGRLIAQLGIHPLIVTLATYAAFRGMAEGISQGQSYSQFGDPFGQLARGTIAGVPYPAFLFAALAITAGVLLGKSPTGRTLYAIGHNEMAAKFSALPVSGTKHSLYVFSGLLAGVVTVIYVSRFDTAKADAGTGMELDVITAVVIGGTSIFGGRGNLLGTALGVLLIHETRLFVGRFWQIDELKSIFVGSLLILSVLIHRAFASRDDE